MIGLVHRLLFGLVESAAGPVAVAEIKRRAGVSEDRYFAMNEVYADDEWQRLFEATCEVLEISQNEAETVFADYFCKDAMTRWPVWFNSATTARQLLEKQPIIHNRFASGLENPEQRAQVEDKFRLETSNGRIVVHYVSPNRLCGLYKKIAQWVLDHYQEHAVITERHCQKNGDPECEISITWT